MEANLAGFRDAQARLREQFGQTIPFFIPLEATWPAGTPLDPETGQPYDPTITPESGGDFAQLDIEKVSVVYRPMGLSRRGVEDDVRSTAIGRMEEGMAALIIGPETWDDEIENATEAIVNLERYTIRQTDLDLDFGTGRHIIYLEQGT